MKKHILSLLFLVVALTTLQCKKAAQPEQLPPITTTGANTFGCLVNGQVWLPYGSFSTSALIINENIMNYGMDGVIIYTGNRKNGALDDLDITLKGIRDTGTYQIRNILDEGLLYSDGTISYEPWDTFGIVKILRCDTTLKIIAGTFSFTGTNPQFNKTVYITEGRFDLHYPFSIK